MAEITNLLLFLPLVFFFFLRIIKRSSSQELPLPPGPYPWPIIGNLFQIRNNPHIQLAKLAQVHGPLMSLRLGHRTLIVGSSPTAASEILKTHDQALSGRDVSRLLQGKDSKVHNMNLVFSDECNDGWRYLRNIYRTELFSAKALESHVEMREKKVMEMVKYLGSKENQKVVIRDVVFTTALNVLSNVFVSMDLVDFEGNGVGAGMMDSIRRLAVLASKPLLADLYPFLGRLDLQRWYEKAMDVFKEIWGVWEDTLKSKRNGSFIYSGQKDFFDVLIQKGFTDEQINSLTQELFSAGTETTGTTVEWAIVDLLRNQKALQKLTDELRQQINGSVVKESDLVNLPYLEACFKETLRLHPPAPILITHRAVKTCEVMGYTIPKDSQIFVNVWALGRDPKIWDDPLSFKPERFIESDQLNYMGKDFEFVPFSSGRRMCPGQPMASKTVPLILASLIFNFEWFPPNEINPSEMDMDEELVFAMHKKEPLHVTLKLRERFKN